MTTNAQLSNAKMPTNRKEEKSKARKNKQRQQLTNKYAKYYDTHRGVHGEQHL